MGLARHKNYIISLQYVKKKVSDEADFLHVDIYQSFLQVDAIFFDGFG